MFTLGFSDPPPPNNLYILCVGYWGGGLLNTNFAGVWGEGGYYFADQSGQGGGGWN